jgi:serine/threonine protein kinase
MIALTRMAQQANHPLPAGFRIDEYCIEHQLSLGGFSIVYVATDAHGQRVAIKEYLPNTLALRSPWAKPRPVITEDHLGAFRYGMKCFFEEGRALAGAVSSRTSMRVQNFFRANDTVYMVMEYEHGCTLQEHDPAPPWQAVTENGSCAASSPSMLNGLREVHTQQTAAPGPQTGQYLPAQRSDMPVLIDFGAARQTLTSDTAHAQTDVHPGLRVAGTLWRPAAQLLGPWSDIYSVGASMYACLAGATRRSRRMNRLEEGPAGSRHGALGGTNTPTSLLEIDRLVHEPQSSLSPAKRLLPCKRPWLPKPSSRLHPAPQNQRKAGWGSFVNRFRKTSAAMKFTIYQDSRTKVGAPTTRTALAYCYSRDALADGRRRRHGWPPLR